MALEMADVQECLSFAKASFEEGPSYKSSACYRSCAILAVKLGAKVDWSEVDQLTERFWSLRPISALVA